MVWGVGRGLRWCWNENCAVGRRGVSSSAEQKCMRRREKRADGVGWCGCGGADLAHPPTPSAMPMALSRTK